MVLNVGTRASKLAIAQTALAEQDLRRVTQSAVNVVRISTKGDRVQDRPLSQVGGKALFVEDIETALRTGQIDLAVHSAKDIPSVLPAEMILAACLPRADARDVLISKFGDSLESLPAGARVGTSSPRRACQVRSIRSDLDLRSIRGNVDTRLAKLDQGEFDAIILAAAGLLRLGLMHRISAYIPLDRMLPCAGQGIIALEIKSTNTELLQSLSQLNHETTFAALTAERAFAAAIGGSCDTPMAAHAQLADGDIVLSAMIGAPSGAMVTGVLKGSARNAFEIGKQLALQLLSEGGQQLLRETQEQHTFRPHQS